MDFKTIFDNTVVSLQKNVNESLYQFTRRHEFYIKALKLNIDSDTAATMSVAYSNKLKYNVEYNASLEFNIKHIIDSD